VEDQTISNMVSYYLKYQDFISDAIISNEEISPIRNGVKNEKNENSDKSV
jgi:hypothetical protein